MWSENIRVPKEGKDTCPGMPCQGSPAKEFQSQCMCKTGEEHTLELMKLDLLKYSEAELRISTGTPICLHE